MQRKPTHALHVKVREACGSGQASFFPCRGRKAGIEIRRLSGVRSSAFLLLGDEQEFLHSLRK